LRVTGLFSSQKKYLRLITLFAFIGAGFSSLETFPQLETGRRVFAQTITKKATKKKKKADSKDNKKKAEDEDSLFIQDSEAAKDYLPDIYRCPECGYEQDESGTCPDHNTMELIKVLSRGRDPLEPAELDGNEDIIVDVPLKDLQFKREEVVPAASETIQPDR